MAIRAPFLCVHKYSGGTHTAYSQSDISNYNSPSEFIISSGNYGGYMNADGTAVSSEITASTIFSIFLLTFYL